MAWSANDWVSKLQKLLMKQGYKEVKKSCLKTIYGKELIDAYEKVYGEEGVMDLARKTAKRGVSFKTPVFDGADFETDIKPLLKDVNLPEWRIQNS